MPRKLEDILHDLEAGRITQEQAADELRTHPEATSMRRTASRSVRVVVGVLALIGLIFFAIGGGFGVYSMRQGENAGRVTGEVIRLQFAGGKGGTKPVVQYVVDGRNFEILGSVSTSPPAYQVGEKVTVLYPRDNPADGSIDSFVERWLFAVIFGGIGALLIVIALIIWLASGARGLAEPRVN